MSLKTPPIENCGIRHCKSFTPANVKKIPSAKPALDQGFYMLLNLYKNDSISTYNVPFVWLDSGGSKINISFVPDGPGLLRLP